VTDFLQINNMNFNPGLTPEQNNDEEQQPREKIPERDFDKGLPRPQDIIEQPSARDYAHVEYGVKDKSGFWEDVGNIRPDFRDKNKD